MFFKVMALVVLFCVILIIIIPLIILHSVGIPLNISHGTQPISVYLHREGRVVVMDLEEYIKGVVAAEVPANFHLEALKAQAVAARTYAAHKMSKYGGTGCSLHEGADICTDFQHGQAWYSHSELREKWGFFSYLRNMYRITTAVNSTRSLVLTYDGKIIDAVYHSSSGSITESAEAVWGYAIPYLQGVSSKYEEHSPYFHRATSFTVEELEQKLNVTLEPFNIERRQANGRVINVITDINECIQVLSRNEGGRVEQVKAGDKVFTGTEFRRKLDLPSTHFSVSQNGNSFTFDTSGFGHGVGMSQYGADGMARSGYSFIDILLHYYRGVDFVSL